MSAMSAGELRRRMDLAGVTVAELARRLGVSRRTVTYWVGAERPIPEGRTFRIRRALETGPRCSACHQLLP